MANKKQDNRVQPRIKNKGVIVDLFVLWLALTALSCAAINLHISLNKLEPKEEEWPVTSGVSKIIRQGWTQNTTEFGSDVLSGKLLQSYDWCVILAGEPSVANISIRIISVIGITELRVRISPAGRKPTVDTIKKPNGFITNHLAFLLVTPMGSDS